MTAEIPSSHRPILEAPGHAVLTTIGPDGAPQSTAVWYLLDGDAVHTSLLATRQKVRNLRRNPKCSLFVFAPDNPRTTIELRGEATLELEIDRAMAHRIIRHYGRDPAAFPDDLSVDRYVFTLRPSRVVTFGGS